MIIIIEYDRNELIQLNVYKYFFFHFFKMIFVDTADDYDRFTKLQGRQRFCLGMLI